MDEEDIERILNSMEFKYGEEKMEMASGSQALRHLLISKYLYGSQKTANVELESGRKVVATRERTEASPSQKSTLSREWLKRYVPRKHKVGQQELDEE